MKRKFALILALLFVLALFAGCNGGGKGGTTTPTAAPSTPAPGGSTPAPTKAPDTTQPTDAPAPPPEEGPYKLAYGKFATDADGFATEAYEYDLPLSTTDEVFTNMTLSFTPQYLPEGGMGDLPMYAGMEELTGVHIEYNVIASASFRETLSVMEASDEMCDITAGFYAYHQGSSLAEAIEEEIIINHYDWKDYAPNYTYQAKKWKFIDAMWGNVNTPTTTKWSGFVDYYDELSDKLWLGGYENGLHIVTLGDDNAVTSDVFVSLTGNAQPQNPIRSICPYDDETMLIGIDGEGVFQMRRDGRGSCSQLFDANESEMGVLHGNGIYSIVVDTWKNIVIGSYSGGIDIARPIGSTAAIYRHVRNDIQSLRNDHVNLVTPLSDHLLLMGTDNGISILDTQTGLWQHCCQGTVVLSACQQPDGGLLVSTYGKGIYEIDRNGQIRHIYTTANSPLTDDHVYATLFDKDGTL